MSAAHLPEGYYWAQFEAHLMPEVVRTVNRWSSDQGVYSGVKRIGDTKEYTVDWFFKFGPRVDDSDTVWAQFGLPREPAE